MRKIFIRANDDRESEAREWCTLCESRADVETGDHIVTVVCPACETAIAEYSLREWYTG